MLEDSEDPAVKTVQPTIKTGRKWKVVEALDQTNKCLKMKEVIGQTQLITKGCGHLEQSGGQNRREEKRDMVINKIPLNEDSRRVQKATQQPQLGQFTN